jgi:hypothetical protein
MPPSLTYDNLWKLTLANTDNSTLDATEACPFIGNGKLGIVPSFDGVNITRCLLTGKDDVMYSVFNTFKTTFTIQEDLSSVCTEMSCDMSIGLFSSKCTWGQSVYIESDFYVPRQLPFCLVKTMRITPLINCDLTFTHEISCPSTIYAPEYNNNVFFDDAQKMGVYTICGSGSGGQFGMSSTYMFEQLANVSNLGFNVYDQRPSIAFNRFFLPNLVAGTTYKIHIVTSIMSDHDFDNPLQECNRMSLNCVRMGMQKIRGNHVKAWNSLWQTDIIITPKVGISSLEDDKARYIKQMLRSAMFMVYCSTRETFGSPNNGNLGLMDFSSANACINHSEFSLVPLLLLLRPELSKPILEYRFKTLNVAKQLAAGMGFAGSKFPYKDDILGYKNNMYWNTYNNLTVYNSALISINVWNYFRATKDRAWLSSVGYDILKSNAEFFVSLIDGLCCHTRPYSISDTIGLSGIISAKNNTLTNGLIRLAIKFAIEASYELLFSVPDVWNEAASWLPLSMYDTNNNKIYKFDDDVDVLGGANVPVAEPLILFIPYYNNKSLSAIQNQNISYSGMDVTTGLLSNLTAYIPQTDINQTINNFIIGICMGVYAQYDQTYILNFMTNLDNFLARNTTGVWMQFTDADANRASMFVMMIVQGLAQLNLSGGVADTRFYYEELSLTCLTSVNMPSTWKNIKIVGAGANKIPYIVQNTTYY